MKRTSRTKAYFGISLIAFLALVGLYWTVYKSVDGQTVRTADVVAEVTREQYRKDHEKSLAATLKTVQADRDKIYNYFIQSDQAVVFIEQVEAIGTAVGAEVAIS